MFQLKKLLFIVLPLSIFSFSLGAYAQDSAILNCPTLAKKNYPSGEFIATVQFLGQTIKWQSSGIVNAESNFPWKSIFLTNIFGFNTWFACNTTDQYTGDSNSAKFSDNTPIITNQCVNSYKVGQCMQQGYAIKCFYTRC